MEKITIKKASEIMNVSQQCIRIALQRKLVDWGFAYKNNQKYSYYINPKDFYAYVGEQK